MVERRRDSSRATEFMPTISPETALIAEIESKLNPEQFVLNTIRELETTDNSFIAGTISRHIKKGVPLPNLNPGLWLKMLFSSLVIRSFTEEYRKRGQKLPIISRATFDGITEETEEYDHSIKREILLEERKGLAEIATKDPYLEEAIRNLLAANKLPLDLELNKKRRYAIKGALNTYRNIRNQEHANRLEKLMNVEIK